MQSSKIIFPFENDYVFYKNACKWFSKSQRFLKIFNPVRLIEKNIKWFVTSIKT